MVRQRQQRGLALTDMLLWSLVFVIFAIFGLKLAPGYVEYFEIQNILKEIAHTATIDGLGNNEIRQRFDKYAEINNIGSVNGTDLKIERESGRPVLSAEYTYQTQLSGNIYLLLDFTASSNGAESAVGVGKDAAGGVVK